MTRRDHRRSRAGAVRRLALMFSMLVIVVTFQYSVSEGPATAAATHGSELGMNIDWTPSINADIAEYAQTGAKWIRFDAFWNGIQLTKNNNPATWFWVTLDNEVLTAEHYGLHVLLMPDYAPLWDAVKQPPCKSLRCAPANASDYAYFVAAVATRYHPGGTVHAHVRSYEIWNEPNGPGWSPYPDPQKYVQMLKLSYGVIKSIDPGAAVITGGVAPSDTVTDPKTGRIADYSPIDFLSAIYKDGARGYFTAVGTHPYSDKKPPLYKATWNAFLNTTKIYAVMKKNGDAGKKIWGTETGYSSSTDWGVGLKKQAKYLTEDVTDWFKWSFAGPLFVFDWRDADTLNSGKFDTTGLLNFDGTPKPALTAFIHESYG